MTFGAYGDAAAVAGVRSADEETIETPRLEAARLILNALQRSK